MSGLPGFLVLANWNKSSDRHDLSTTTHYPNCKPVFAANINVLVIVWFGQTHDLPHSSWACYPLHHWCGTINLFCLALYNYFSFQGVFVLSWMSDCYATTSEQFFT